MACKPAGVEPRVAALTEEEARAAAAAAGIPEYVTVLNLNRVLLRHPTQARDFVQYFWDLMYEGRLDPRLRELAIMRIAWVTGSEYEWAQHWHLATGLGIAPDDLLAVRDWRSSDRVTRADRAVLAATDDVLEQGAVQPGSWAQLEIALPDPSVCIEAVLAITGWRMVASLLLSLDVPLEDGVEPWPPDGVRP